MAVNKDKVDFIQKNKNKKMIGPNLVDRASGNKLNGCEPFLANKPIAQSTWKRVYKRSGDNTPTGSAKCKCRDKEEDIRRKIDGWNEETERDDAD